MPLYEYYCEKGARVFEALRPLSESEVAVPCPDCARDADRIMPTSFSAMSWNRGYPQRVPYHQKPVRNVSPKKPTVARVKGTTEPKPQRRPGKGDVAASRDQQVAGVKDLRYRDRWGVDQRGFRTVKAKKAKPERKGVP